MYSPKWLKGLTVSADWWHIDMRSIVCKRWDPQFLINNSLNPAFASQVIRTPPPAGFPWGPVWWAGFGPGSFWSTIPTLTFRVRSSKGSITKRSISLIRRSSVGVKLG